MNINWGLCEAKDIVGEMVTVVDVGVSGVSLESQAMIKNMCVTVCNLYYFCRSSTG